MSHTVTAARPDTDAPAGMTHRQVLEALSGLLLGMLVAILSSTVVSTSLPKIIADLGGTQSSYTWVVTSTLLATTVSTPLWGKFADLFNRKLLLQLSLVVFVVGSGLAGLSTSSGMLIGFRVLQGLGAGGLTALSTVVMADIISPRERGRYMGYLGAVMAVGTLGGPLLGGFITDGIGWRWNFYVGVPIAAVAIVVLQRTLHLPTLERRAVSIDYLGAALISGSVSLLLIWVTLGGQQFDWGSWQSMVMVGGSLLMGALLMVVELRAPEPILPLSLFRNRTVVLAIVASVSVGVAMFGTTVFLSQYMQLARGKTPTESGLLTMPLIIGVLLSSTIAGQLISRTGVWKRYVVSGGVLLVIGMALMGTIRYDTSWTALSISMFVMGVGVGMVMQNLVLVVQNVLPIRQMGAGTAAVAFFRSLGGAVGVSAMGAILASRVLTLLLEGLTKLHIPASAMRSTTTVPDLSTLPVPIRLVVERAYGEAVGDIFLAALPVAVVALIAVAFLPNARLGTRSGAELLLEESEAAAGLTPVLDEGDVEAATAGRRGADEAAGKVRI
ncbi:MAG TPA: MDR family MFS transporter [Actinomycetales bacterium]|nr:MDR family MFS transporter [Actinomycetales bacterium]